MNRRILQLAIPSIVSNITVPLLGLVDVTIVGHLGSAAYIGAIAVGGLLFNILYWNFGFLRMGTSGLTSQAYGRKDADAEVKVLVQAVSVGLISAAAILILQYPVERLAFYLLDTSPEVEQYAVTYFRVCIWGAPAVLAMYGFKGWFIGMQNSRFPMYIAIAVNIINIVCSLCFVFVLGMKVEGVAWEPWWPNGRDWLWLCYCGESVTGGCVPGSFCAIVYNRWLCAVFLPLTGIFF